MTIPSFLADLDLSHLVNATSMLAKADVQLPAHSFSIAYGVGVGVAMELMSHQNTEEKGVFLWYALGLAIFDAILPDLVIILLVEGFVGVTVLMVAMKCSVWRAIATWLLAAIFTILILFALLLYARSVLILR